MAKRCVIVLVVLAFVAGCGGSESDSGDRAACAAADLDPDLEPDPTLPEPVADTEVAILRAAVACDADGLESLADFDLGRPRFATLVELFEGPVVLDGDTYVWPGTEENGTRTAIAADGTWQYYETGETDAAAPPAELVAALGDKVTVLPSDGGLALVVADGQQGATRVAVSADGATVYFTRSDPDVICDQGLATQIVSVPVEGGSPTIVASGQGAVVSPDGARIAYATGGANQCGPPNQLVVQDLDTDRFTQELFEGGDLTLAPLAWSPDSQSVLYSAAPSGAGQPEIREVEVGTSGPPRTVPVPVGAYLATYLGEPDSLAVVQDDGAGVHVLEIDAATGDLRRTLFEVPERPAFRSLVADSSGRHLLFTTLAGAGGGDRIWRWSDGSEPVVVLETSNGETAEDAVWMPEREPVRRAGEEAVALSVDGRVVVLDAKTGEEVRTLARGAMTDWSGVTVDREDGVVYFTRPWSSPPCVGLGPSGAVPEIVRVALDGGPAESVAPADSSPVTGYYPVVNPAQKSVAFMGAPCGEGLLAGFYLPTPRTPAGPIWAGTAEGTVVEPLAWSTDAESLLFEATMRGGSEPQVFVAGTPVNGRAQVTSVWGPGGYTAATYRGDALVIAESRDDGFRVVEVNGARERRLFRGSGPSPTAIEFDESGDELLYVADGVLFRWGSGDQKPTRLADGILDADWATGA